MWDTSGLTSGRSVAAVASESEQVGAQPPIAASPQNLRNDEPIAYEDGDGGARRRSQAAGIHVDGSYPAAAGPA